MRSLKKIYYPNGLMVGSWYIINQDGCVWVFRLYKWIEVSGEILVRGGCFSLLHNDRVENYYAPNLIDSRGVGYNKWGVLRDFGNIRRIKFSKVKDIIEKNGYELQKIIHP